MAIEAPDAGGGSPERWGEMEVMQRIQQGEPAALDELLRRYWKPLVSYASRIVPDEGAEDVVQEAILRVWNDRERWTPTDRLSSFLYRITRNLALNESRARKSRLRRREAKAHEPQPPVRTPADDLHDARLQAMVQAALEELPERRREVFVLIRYHGMSYREAAEVLDMAPQTVANHVSGALALLRRYLEPVLRERGMIGS